MIVGHKKIRQYLSSGGKKAHAYFFYGPAHVGKEAVAKWFAKTLVCEKNNRLPCYKCKQCMLIQKNAHPDLYFVKPAPEEKTIKIEQIRNLQNKIAKTTFHNSYKIVIIKLVEQVTKEALNAFLKTLEEPTKKTVFILIGSNTKFILPTILSRTEPIKFSLVKKEKIIASLDNKFNQQQKKFIANYVQGKIGKAISLTGDKVKKLVNMEKSLVKMLKSKSFKKIAFAEKQEKEYTQKTSCYILSIIRDVLLIKIGMQEKITHYYLKKELTQLANTQKLTTLKQISTELIHFPTKLKHNINHKLLWQNTLLKIQ